MKRFITHISVVAGSAILAASVCLARSGGDVVGNGGDVVLCLGSDSGATAQLLDHYEATEWRKIEIDLGLGHWAPLRKIEYAMGRFSRIDPVRAMKYLERSRDFFNEAVFKRGIELVDIPDSAHLAFKAGCKPAQIAIQNSPRFVEDKRFIVNEDLWDLLDNDGKAGLIMHEIIYEELLSYGDTNSINARYLNAKLSSVALAAMGPHEYVDIWKRFNLRKRSTVAIGISGKLFELLSVRFYDEGQLESANLFEPSEFVVGDQNLKLSGRISFYQSGNVMYADLHEDTLFPVDGKKILLRRGSVGFYESGTLKNGRLAEDTQLRRTDGAQEFFWKGDYVQFDETGRARARQ